MREDFPHESNENKYVYYTHNSQSASFRGSLSELNNKFAVEKEDDKKKHIC